jgi:hypothetical protein
LSRCGHPLNETVGQFDGSVSPVQGLAREVDEETVGERAGVGRVDEESGLLVAV